jgi:hypothetical protein
MAATCLTDAGFWMLDTRLAAAKNARLACHAEALCVGGCFRIHSSFVIRLPSRSLGEGWCFVILPGLASVPT